MNRLGSDMGLAVYAMVMANRFKEGAVPSEIETVHGTPKTGK